MSFFCGIIYSFAEDRIINPLEDIEDREIQKIVGDVAKNVNKAVERVWKEIGRENIQSFSKWFHSYFERFSLKDFLMMMDAVHAQLTKMIPGAKPPRLIAKEVSSDEIEIKYASSRGMFDYFLGLLEGSADFFKEKIACNEVERGNEGESKVLRVKIKLEKRSGKVNNYTVSKILSLGFLKSVPLKISVFSTAASAAAVIVVFPSSKRYFEYCNYCCNSG